MKKKQTDEEGRNSKEGKRTGEKRRMKKDSKRKEE